MSIYDLFSKRKKRMLGEIPEIYVYDDIPNKLKVQVIHIIDDAIGHPKNSLYEDKVDEVYEFIRDALCREYGLFELLPHHHYIKNEVNNFFLKSTTDEALDLIELTFRLIEKYIKDENHSYHSKVRVKLNPKEAINELNERFRENGIGYSYENGEIIRIDSTYVHSEVTKPAISLLYNSMFEGANEEYMKAHQHYRDGENKECLANCLKAFESTMKIICKEKSWAFNQNDTSKKLIQICFQNNLVPSFTQNQFTSLQNLLESGIPTIRNKLGGHGQGAVPQKVDDEMTRYALNLTGANIIFLIGQSGL